MLNRRQIRIKILQSLYAFFQSDNGSKPAGNKELMLSISKMYEMYVFYLTLFGELARHAELKSEEIKNRKFSSSEDALVHQNFLNNSFIKTLSQQYLFVKCCRKPKCKLGGRCEARYCQEIIQLSF